MTMPTNPPGYETVADRRFPEHILGDADAMRENLRAMVLEQLQAAGCTCTPVIQIDPTVDFTARSGAAPVRVWHLTGCAGSAAP